MRFLFVLCRITPIACALLSIVAGLPGCRPAADHEVVVYSALDAEFSEPVLQQFARREGVRVDANFDVESTKTVGLVTRIIHEKDRPRCDVFWNNEILHTLRLQKLGLLEAYDSPAGRKLPANYRSPEGYWYGFAARARILIVNTDLVPEDRRPRSISDLIAPEWKGRVGIAKPLFGTTATHAAVLFARWGRQRAARFFEQVKKNAGVLSGNKQVAMAVGRGELAFGLTDTDDAVIELEQGRPVALVYPDQHEGGMGTLFIPNTVCVIKKCPHPREARKLVEYLLRPEVEKRLAEGPSAQFPVSPLVSTRSRVAPETDVRWMDVDFQAAADQWETASRVLRDMFASAR